MKLKKISLPKFMENELDCSIVFERNVSQDVSQDLTLLIIDEIKKNSKITREVIAKKANVSSKTIGRHIEKMKDKIKYVGSGFSGHWEIIE